MIPPKGKYAKQISKIVDGSKSTYNGMLFLNALTFITFFLLEFHVNKETFF